MKRPTIFICLITYNRRNKLRNTLDQILSSASPISQNEIVILDNASDDGSSEIIEDYILKHPNIRHLRHKINIGGNANICRAFEMGASSDCDYVWVICDDDKFDFGNWGSVVKGMEQGEAVIGVSNYCFSTPEQMHEASRQIIQLAFVPSGIYRRDLLTGDVLINMYDTIYTMFPQLCISIDLINRGGKILILNRPIVYNGFHLEEHPTYDDMSYTRGMVSSITVSDRRKNQVWISGFSNILMLVNQASIRQESMEACVPMNDCYGDWDRFYNDIFTKYYNADLINYFNEILKVLPGSRQKEIRSYIKSSTSHKAQLLCADELPESKRSRYTIKYFLQAIFSISVSRCRRFWVIKLLGIRFKIKRSSQPE